MYKICFSLSAITLVLLVSFVSTGMLELNFLVSSSMLIVGLIAALTSFGAFFPDKKSETDSFEDYMKSLKDRMDR